MQSISEVNNTTQINSAEFVKLTIYNDYNNTANVSIHTFSSSYKAESINGDIYLPLSGFLQVGGQSRDLRVTSGDTILSISGVSGNNMSTVLSTKIRGSDMEIIRGFYDENSVISTVYTRFSGIVTSYDIQEDLDGNTDNFTITLGASSYKSVLENRIAGRKTNKESWHEFDPSDNSMNQVYAISGVNFDFGKEPKAKTTTTGGANFNTPWGPY